LTKNCTTSPIRLSFHSTYRITADLALVFLELKSLDLQLALSEADEEYSGKLQFHMNGAELVTVTTSFRTGQASALIKTPGE
jgi:hypothetical protein